jgi:biopolymer transport protein ExbB/TolQ
MLTRLPHQTPLLRVRSTAALVGFLGAIMGAINALTGVAAGRTRLDAVTAGIAEALITTVVFLLVVIPAAWIYNQFKAESRRRK